MSKKPVPSKRLSKDRGRNRHSVYVQEEIVRLRKLAASPYSGPAAPKDKAGKALKKITRVKA